MVKIAISGCCGKMGSRILALAQAGNVFQVVSLLEKKGHASVGSDVAGMKVSDAIDDIGKADVLIEFTSPESTMMHLDICCKHKKAIVIGTTGLSDEQIGKITKASEKIPIVFSPNMSVGVNVLFGLLKEAAQKLPAEYAASIIEAHHVHKKDAPSGTAKKLALIIKEQGRGDVTKEIASIREDEIVGDHTVVFESPVDTITLCHSAKTRDIFAKGALVAAEWIVGKKNGLYSMEDIL